MNEVIIQAKSTEAAVALGAEQLGKTVDEVSYEVLEEAKKGLFGIGASDAKVRVYYEEEPEEAAISLLNTVIGNMGIDATARVDRVEESVPEGKQIPEKNVYVVIEGDELGSLIGRHGDVLDSLQYLANIAAGRRIKDSDEKKEYVKICLDIENYREKREATLKALARRTADKAVRYHRNMTLEPMLAYERKIIHAELQDYEGVFTYSVGSDNDRRVVIALGTPENPIKPRSDRRPYGRRYRGDGNKY